MDPIDDICERINYCGIQIDSFTKFLEEDFNIIAKAHYPLETAEPDYDSIWWELFKYIPLLNFESYQILNDTIDRIGIELMTQSFRVNATSPGYVIPDHVVDLECLVRSYKEDLYAKISNYVP
tara:strand:+ start:27 stop:395 length:369 start_codon:yes stop_codon:yes gene_type:complete